MQIRINVKGASRKKAAIVQTTCDYPEQADDGGRVSGGDGQAECKRI